ncbi:efflux transporter periplasmic adaptor subunit [Spirosoma montaniterrae]|uniref:Efflux transporter periplasmic adaptor subunit n=2 Tax=Spirosoma montaniterrae TaxID=1178516 RepID=A0A1P9X4U7_9BACT|nr:efflux transporter periplasmic adaptor subunit [Spirosoma montaniterrae]
MVWATLALLTGVLAGCQSTARSDQSAQTDKPTVNLLANARIDTARLAPVADEIALTGKITFNQDRIVKVFPLVGGHIETVRADLGDYVRKGQVLAMLRSGDLADLSQQAVAARGQVAVAQKNLQVAEDMTKAGLSSQRDLVAAREQFLAAKGELARVGERQRIMGSAGSAYAVKAPMSGFVVEKSASPGMELRSDDPENLFTISNLDQVWVIANVYESDLSHIQVGNQATITTLSYPDRVFRGKIDKVFNMLDPDSKTLRVRVTLPNPDFTLKPEMFANVSVQYAGHEQRVAIPANAVLFDKSRNFVVAVTQQGQPVVREVNVFKTIGDRTYLTSGLQAGERVVSQNGLLIYNALSN